MIEVIVYRLNSLRRIDQLGVGKVFFVDFARRFFGKRLIADVVDRIVFLDPRSVEISFERFFIVQAERIINRLIAVVDFRTCCGSVRISDVGVVCIERIGSNRRIESRYVERSDGELDFKVGNRYVSFRCYVSVEFYEVGNVTCNSFGDIFPSDVIDHFLTVGKYDANVCREVCHVIGVRIFDFNLDKHTCVDVVVEHNDLTVVFACVDFSVDRSVTYRIGELVVAAHDKTQFFNRSVDDRNRHVELLRCLGGFVNEVNHIVRPICSAECLLSFRDEGFIPNDVILNVERARIANLEVCLFSDKLRCYRLICSLSIS